MKTFRHSETKKVLGFYKSKPAAYWTALQKKTILDIFKTASTSVDAYQKFLRGHGINSKKIASFSDIAALPAVTKSNYFRKFPLRDVATNGSYENLGLVMTATSGSTGLPSYFPRNDKIDWQYSVLAEFFLNNSSTGPTLVIDCFGMGVWIGGVITYQAFRYAALRGHAATVITPGINKKEIFHALRELAPKFKHVIIAGYPPFVKDILDEAASEKIDFRKFHLRLLFAAESFTEQFRDYVCAVGKIKNPYLDTLNIYGSAELGAMAFETPGSIFIRRLALKQPKLFQNIFPAGGSPTLAQYNPGFVLFEQLDKKILISAMGPVPFVRYDIGDTGGTYGLDEITTIFKEHNIDLKIQAKKHGVELLNLPFVYVDVRSDFAVKLYGAIIYPPPIQGALQGKQFEKTLTGKFTLQTKTDKKHNQYLEINLELKSKIIAANKISALAKKYIVENLLKKNAEYKNNFHSLNKKVIPIIKLWPYESPEYFKPGTKQKWVVTK